MTAHQNGPMALDRRAALRGWWSFQGAGPATRAFLLARLCIIPLDSMDRELRSMRGRVLSVGCGHGVLERYLAEINPHVEIVGTELDEERVEVAARSSHRYPRVEVRHGDARALDDAEGFDAALAVDLFHHLDPGTHAGVLVSMAAALRPGGVCLVKDMDVRPRWKYHWNRLHDRFVNRDRIHCVTPDAMGALVAAAGLSVERQEHVDRPYGPYPQYVVVGRKPASA